MTLLIHPSRFFSHTGEVAGVFTAVGIVAIVIIALIATTCIRRRRAERFDKDVAEAAMEAAATSRTNAWDDDDAYNTPGGYGAKAAGYGGGAGNYGGAGGYGGTSAENAPYAAGYSSESHGTYGQPPMEAYAMHNVGSSAGHYEVGQVVDPALLGGAAGAAGIGAMRARSMNRGGQDGGYDAQEHTPYAAFAGPPAGGVTGQQLPDPYGANLRYRRSSGAEPELLAAAGLGGAAGMGMNRRGSERTAGTHTSNPRSVGSFGPVAEDPPANHSSSSGHTPPHNDESYASHYQPGYAPAAADPFKRNTMPPQQQQAYGDSDGEEEDAYAYEGGYVDDHAEARGSLDDDGFYGAPPRVLKVANE
ncbi:hypothetical protein HWV62_35456 [Athelia sp. TMB]|nr:hypothetical protein HWV62_35456 [Athelia sp. TMB]